MTTRIWDLGMLQPGEEREIRVSGIPANEGAMESCVHATFEHALCTTVQVTRPELRLTRQWVNRDGEPADSFFVCDPVFIRYTIQNEGSGTTPAGEIVEQLPEGATTEQGAQQITIPIEQLPAGQAQTHTVTVEVRQPGEFSGRAFARAGQLETQSIAQSVRFMIAELDVDVVGPAEQYIGRDVQYQVTVTNTSDVAPALNTQIRIPGIDEQMRFAMTDQRIPREVDLFSIGDLEPGESRSFGVVFSATEAGEVATEIQAMAHCAQPATTSIATTFQGVSALHVTVTDSVDPVPVNGETTYEIILVNEGTAADASVQLSGQLPENMEFVSATGDTEVTGNGGRIDFAPVQQLPPGGRVSWLVTARGVEPGKGDFTLEIESEAGTASAGEPTTVF
jgi:uncharacterized repeat protein (TIGR01451 family)